MNKPRLLEPITLIAKDANVFMACIVVLYKHVRCIDHIHAGGLISFIAFDD